MKSHAPYVPRTLAVLLFGLAILTSVGTASAAPTLLVIAAGDEADKQILEDNATAALRNVEVQVASKEDAELAGFDAQFTLSCLEESEDCGALLSKAPAEWVLLLGLRKADAPDGERTVIAKLFSANDGGLLQVEQRVCQRCTSSERLAREIAELTIQITSAELAHSATETYLEVSSSPAGAILSIDGSVVGPTGQLYRVTPGQHTVEVSQPGYISSSQTLEVRPNEHKALRMSLVRGEANSPKRNYRRLLSWGAIGLGVGGVAGGITLLAIDGNRIGNGGVRDEVRDTKLPGIASLVAGTALIGGGIALLLMESTEGDTQVSAMPTEGGLALGLGGRF